MVSSLKTFDASKSGKMTELTQTKHRFGILVGFPYNIAYRKGFGISTCNTIYGPYNTIFGTSIYGPYIIIFGAPRILNVSWIFHLVSIANKYELRTFPACKNNIDLATG